MSLGLRLNGKVLGIEPGTTTVYTNRDAVGEWEAITATPHAQWSDLKFVAANRQLGVDERTRQLDSRPAGDIDRWGGQWLIAQTAAGWTATCDQWTLALDGAAPPAAAIHLEQRGHDFVDAAGQRVVYAGCDMFLAYRQYVDGGAAALVPFVMESRACGFTVWRVFMQGSARQNQVLELNPKEPGYYDFLHGFATTLNANGIILLATIYVDNQDVRSDLGHWSRMAEALAGTQTLLSGFNQWSKNKSDFDPWALPDPGHGLIWSRGSDTDDVQTPPRGAPASELHATRNSFDRALMDSTASPPFMRKPESQGGGGSGMVWMTEGNPFGDAHGYSEHQAWQLGRGYSIDWALAVFHNRQSQRGLRMTPETARCGAAWVQGMRL